VAIIDPKTNAVVGAIDSGSTNGHRLCIPDDGQRLYTDNEEDATVSVIDLPNRKLLGKIATPEKLAGIAVSADGKTTLSARGLTGPSAYTVNNSAPGSPYGYTIDAQFERSRGSGKRNELRPCSFTFVKR